MRTAIMVVLFQVAIVGVKSVVNIHDTGAVSIYAIAGFDLVAECNGFHKCWMFDTPASNRFFGVANGCASFFEFCNSLVIKFLRSTCFAIIDVSPSHKPSFIED